MQQTPILLARTRSSPSRRRLRLERDTATNCDHLALDHVPSPRVQRVQVRAASGLDNDTTSACGVVQSGLFVCVLTAEQRPACLVQHGLVPLERFLRLVRRRVVHDEKPAWQNHGRQTRHDEILHHVQSLRRGDLHASGHQLQMRRQAASNETTTRVTRHS